jgi:hypothetical protein
MGAMPALTLGVIGVFQKYAGAELAQRGQAGAPRLGE